MLCGYQWHYFVIMILLACEYRTCVTWGVVNKMWSKSLNDCYYSKVVFITKVRAMILSVILRKLLQRKSLYHTSSYVVHVHMEICFPEWKINLVAWFVCSASFNTFFIYLHSSEMQYLVACVWSITIKIHTVRRLHTVCITICTYQCFAPPPPCGKTRGKIRRLY